jgi:3-deoxy-7-phosphoheptulonate synthase
MKTIDINGIKIGGGNPPVIIAGPCAVEDEETLMKTAADVKAAGAEMLRGGAWKPRTFPGKFEGLHEKGLEMLRAAGKKYGMPIVTEVMSTDKIDMISKHADVLQVGTRNMQNFDLLDKLGKAIKPVILKRGMSATIDEFLGAAERIIKGGNDQVILCLRGVRTFDHSQRYPADLYAIPDLLSKTDLPVIFDPSHAAGKRDLVESLCRMAIAGGAHGLIIETSCDPDSAKCDAKQMITPDILARIVRFTRDFDQNF